MADGNVIQFPAGSVGTLLCTDCGCMTWFVYDDGSLMCAGCDNVPDGHARIQVPEDAERRDAGDDEPTAWAARHYDEETQSYDMAMRRFAERLKAGEFAAVVAVKSDGGQHAVTAPGYNIDTRERRLWLLRALRRGYQLMVKGS